MLIKISTPAPDGIPASWHFYFVRFCTAILQVFPQGIFNILIKLCTCRVEVSFVSYSHDEFTYVYVYDLFIRFQREIAGNIVELIHKGINVRLASHTVLIFSVEEQFVFSGQQKVAELSNCFFEVDARAILGSIYYFKLLILLIQSKITIFAYANTHNLALFINKHSMAVSGEYFAGNE